MLIMQMTRRKRRKKNIAISHRRLIFDSWMFNAMAGSFFTYYDTLPLSFHGSPASPPLLTILSNCGGSICSACTKRGAAENMACTLHAKRHTASRRMFCFLLSDC